MRVLIAEDDPISRRVLQSALTKRGYEVEVVCDGEAAWAALQEPHAPRLAVLDWMMPGLDGLEVCKKLRARAEGPYIYTILLTAKAQRDDMLMGLNSGADDYVVKPFDPNELHARLRSGKRVLDLQAQLLAAEESARMQAIIDPLTGLPNRLLFGEKLKDGLERASREDRPLAVLFLDLDNFKIINDSLGHNVGDTLLKSVAERLSGALRASDTLARMGGDEFTCVLERLHAPCDAAAKAEQLIDLMSEPFNIDGREMFVSASIGISVFPADGDDAETLVRNADAAMYRAKDRGKNAVHMFTEDLNEAVSERMMTESGLRRAIERDELELHYQIRVDLSTGVTPGMEALVRWRHPERGLLFPDSFIHVAEDCGMIEPLTEWVLAEACRQNKEWQDAGFMRMDVGVNISPKLFHRVDLVKWVEKVLSASRLAPRYLNLELTETAMMQSPEHAVQVLTNLKAMGVSNSIDDFGTGYSSLSQLGRLPIDAVKIDASFVRTLTGEDSDDSIPKAIIAMAHSLNLRVVAEGVENLSQLQHLTRLGCDEIQGYFISRPVSACEVVHLLAEGTPPRMNWLSLAA